MGRVGRRGDSSTSVTRWPASSWRSGTLPRPASSVSSTSSPSPSRSASSRSRSRLRSASQIVHLDDPRVEPESITTGRRTRLLDLGLMPFLLGDELLADLLSIARRISTAWNGPPSSHTCSGAPPRATSPAPPGRGRRDPLRSAPSSLSFEARSRFGHRPAQPCRWSFRHRGPLRCVVGGRVEALGESRAVPPGASRVTGRLRGGAQSASRCRWWVGVPLPVPETLPVPEDGRDRRRQALRARGSLSSAIVPGPWRLADFCEGYAVFSLQKAPEPVSAATSAGRRFPVEVLSSSTKSEQIHVVAPASATWSAPSPGIRGGRAPSPSTGGQQGVPVTSFDLVQQIRIPRGTTW